MTQGVKNLIRAYQLRNGSNAQEDSLDLFLEHQKTTQPLRLSSDLAPQADATSVNKVIIPTKPLFDLLWFGTKG